MAVRLSIFERLAFWLSRKAARRAFSAAWSAHRGALDRGDTRLQRQTRQALTRAMNARLKVGA